jgi:hypothetical protein
MELLRFPTPVVGSIADELSSVGVRVDRGFGHQVGRGGPMRYPVDYSPEDLAWLTAHPDAAHP